ncbi:MAG TPA: enoyl-CoA hydratase/isomerase family protein, partial [Propionibacteriaceae bacterium]|nr:enoyl-CoA hydratase/isomerase family protein [Propionibacteriaceae bacterium]
MDGDVVFLVDDGVGRIRLNRPRAINALTHDMCLAVERQLLAWVDDDAVSEVELSGEGERGLCSGADVRALREHVLTEPARAIAFFTDEYRLDALIADYPKPFTALMHGICMGGGLGLSLHASRRVGTATTQLAMPETTIGLFPDVGSCYHLARCPGEVGAHLAMTGVAIDAASALWAGLIDELPDADPSTPCVLARDASWIDECYVGDAASGILARLEAHDDPRAREAGALIRTKSPWSVCVSLEA